MVRPVAKKLFHEMGDIGLEVERCTAAGKDRGEFGIWLIKFFNKQAELIAAEYVSAAMVLAERVGCNPGRMKARFDIVASEVVTEYSDSSADELLAAWDDGCIEKVLAERMKTVPSKLAAAYTDRTVSMIMLGVREKMANGKGVTADA